MKPLLLLTAIASACTANRPFAVAPESQPLGQYLQDHHPQDFQVTDTLGRNTWIHNPELVGDSIVGLASRELPHQRRAIALSEVRGFAEPHFSAGRTLAIAGGVLTVTGFALLIASMDGDEPIYASAAAASPK